MTFFKKVFHKKQKQEPKPLRVEGVKPAPMTPEPDDAELAAAALLEHMQEVQGSRFLATPHSQREKVQGDKDRNNDMLESRDSDKMKDAPHDAAYFKALSERIRKAHESARLRTQRFLAFCEQELKKPDLPKEGPGSLGLLNAELYKRIDVVQRHGGELEQRWMHCLAEVTVRLNDGMPPVSVNDN